jgi:hypothetical protein
MRPPIPARPSTHRRVASISFDPIPRLHRDQRGRHHDAILSQLRQLPMQAITAGTGFVAKAHLPAILAKLLHQLGDLISTIGDDPQVTNLTPRSPSATATEIVALWTSSPTKMLSFIRPAPHA